jgi:hypothetical protein
MTTRPESLVHYRQKDGALACGATFVNDRRVTRVTRYATSATCPACIEKARPVDIRVENHGSIFLMVGASKAGLDWLAENVETTAQWFNYSVAVEPRYVVDIVEGARSAGLEVR